MDDQDDLHPMRWRSSWWLAIGFVCIDISLSTDRSIAEINSHSDLFQRAILISSRWVLVTGELKIDDGQPSTRIYFRQPLVPLTELPITTQYNGLGMEEVCALPFPVNDMPLLQLKPHHQLHAIRMTAHNSSVLCVCHIDCPPFSFGAYINRQSNVHFMDL